MEKIEALLQRLAIPFQKFEHPAVFSCEESAVLCPPMPGISTKQLLMTEKKGDRVILAIVSHDKKVDMLAFAKHLEVKPLQFATEKMLEELLHVSPGSVTPFGLLFDLDHRVEVIVDEDAWEVGVFQFHPLVNTATLIIDREGFQKWLAHTGYGFLVVQIPTKIMSIKS